MHPSLRFNDGFGRTTPHLRNDVLRLQRALVKLGHPLEPDGLFGRGTERQVIAFQRDQGLQPDGIVGPKTWKALETQLPRTRRSDRFANVEGLESFRGDLRWVHEREGHAGTAYWPGGRSGVTLDPGFDLGRQTLERTKELYGERIKPAQYRAIRAVTGLRGDSAKEALKRNPVLREIRINRAQALAIMPHVAAPYWSGIVRSFPRLADSETPPSVQTALLSISYNRGPGNRDVREKLAEAIAQGAWLGLADAIGAMQQDHPLQGIRIRRRQEADLIRQELGFTA